MVTATVLRRSRRRGDQRGAALFLVMLAILMLSGVGTWASFAAGNMAKGTGYARMAQQTQYVTELGTLSATAYLSLPGMARTNYQLANTGAETCRSVPSGSRCRSIGVLELDGVTSGDSGATLMDLTNSEGSLSAYADDVQADFTVEMSSPIDAPVAGSAIAQSHSALRESPYKRVTLTAYGIIRPSTNVAVGGDLCTAGGNDSDNFNSAAGRMSLRAHAIIGPVN